MTDYSTFLDMTAEEIAEDWLDFMEARDPRLRDKSVYSFNRMFAEGVAVQFWLFAQLLKQKIEESGIMTATGTALDAVVADRLPDGRYPGTKASGTIRFHRDSVATYEIEIPLGTRVAAVGESGETLYFKTIEATAIEIGEMYGYADAEAEVIGTDYNVAAEDIDILATAIAGVQGAINDEPFTGGTDIEDDDDFRNRAIYTIWVPGKATVPMLTEHVGAVEGVREVKVSTLGQGDVLLVIDAEAEIGDDIAAAIYDDLAAGCTCPGVLGASLRSTGHTFSIGDTSGGDVWVRALEYVASETVVNFVYIDEEAAPQNGSVTFPAGSPAGETLKATLDGDAAVSISSSVYAGSLSFDIYMGLGEYPHLWIAPELQATDMSVVVVMTTTPETGLLDNIKASLEDAIGAYQIADQLQYSDLEKYIYRDFTTGRAFVGIDYLASQPTITCKGETIDAHGESISIDDDERVICGTVTVAEPA